MLLILVAATSLLIQAYVFRDTPSHPFDRCAAEPARCPEESLDSLLAAREDRLARLRSLAAGTAAADAETRALRSPAGIDTSRIGSRDSSE